MKDSGQAGMTGIHAIADKLESSTEQSLQLTLFSGSQEGLVPQIKGRGRQRKGITVSEESLKEHRGATTLDRVHAAMLLQASGRANALRALLNAEIERSPDFLRLANALMDYMNGCGLKSLSLLKKLPLNRGYF